MNMQKSRRQFFRSLDRTGVNVLFTEPTENLSCFLEGQIVYLQRSIKAKENVTKS